MNIFSVEDWQMKHITDLKWPDGEINYIPRFAAIYSLNDNNVIKLMYGKAIKQPSIMGNWDIVSYYASTGTVLPFLKEEEIQTIELNYIATFSKKLSVNFSLFQNSMDNLIGRDVKLIGGMYVSQSGNFGEMQTNGIEVALRTKPIEKIDIDLAVTYQDTKDQNNEDIAVAFSPKILAFAKIAINQDLNKLGKLTFAITGNYVDEMESYWDPTLTDPADVNSPAVGRIGDKVSSYFKLGANLRVDNFLLNGLYFNVKGANLLDEQIHYPTYTRNQWADRGMIGRGRHIMFSLGYKF